MIIVQDSYGTYLKVGLFTASELSAYLVSGSPWAFPDDPPDVLDPASGLATLPVFLYVLGHTPVSAPWYSFADRAQFSWSFNGQTLTQQVVRAGRPAGPPGYTLFSPGSQIQDSTYVNPAGPNLLGVPGNVPWLNLDAGTYTLSAEWKVWNDGDGPTLPLIDLTTSETITVANGAIPPGPFWPPFAASAQNGPQNLHFVRSKK